MMILIELNIAHRHMQIISSMRANIALDALNIFSKFCAFCKLCNELIALNLALWAQVNQKLPLLG